MASPNDIDHIINRYIAFFEELSPQTLHHAEGIFSTDVYFRDPFNELKNRDQLKQVFEDMFEQCDSYAFKISSKYLVSGFPSNSFILKWRFKADIPKIGYLDFVGLSEVEINSEGQVISHIDYWDSATHFYMKLPILKQLIGYIRRKLKVTT